MWDHKVPWYQNSGDIRDPVIKKGVLNKNLAWKSCWQIWKWPVIRCLCLPAPYQFIGIFVIFTGKQKSKIHLGWQHCYSLLTSFYGFFSSSRLLFKWGWPADWRKMLVALLPLLHFVCKASPWIGQWQVFLSSFHSCVCRYVSIGNTLGTRP